MSSLSIFSHPPSSPSPLQPHKSVHFNLFRKHLHLKLVQFVFKQSHLTNSNIASGAGGKETIIGTAKSSLFNDQP